MRTAGAIWVHVEYRSEPYDTVVSYADSLGNVHQAPPGGPPLRGWDYQPLVGGLTPVLWPQPATAHLLNAVAAAPSWRVGYYSTGPVPVAVIIRPPDGAEDLGPWEARTEALLETLGVARLKYSLAIDARWTAEPRSLELPLKILVSGPPLPELHAYAAGITAGIEVAPADGLPLAELPSDVDVVVVPVEAARSLLALGPAWSPPPIVLIDGPEHMPELRPDAVPAGTSIIRLPFIRSDGGDRMVKEIVAGLVHDLPLHEAVASAGRSLGLDRETRRQVRVFTTAAGLEQLRLDPLLDRIRSHVRDLAKLRSLEGMPAALGQRGVVPPLTAPDMGLLTRAIEGGSALVRDFTRESLGLGPVAESSGAIDAADAALRYVESAAAEISRDPGLLEQLESEQGRRVAIWVSETDGALAGLWDGAGLAYETAYDLNVGVGIRWDNDLVPADAPALDPILPPTEEKTYPITVSVFSDSADFAGPASQRLDVARIGPSGPVSFTFRTPGTGARTRIRVILYYRRHLLQVFGLEAHLAEYPQTPEAGKGLVVTPLFSRTAQLSHVDSDFTARALTMATNADGDGRHRLMFDTGDGVPFDEAALLALQTGYRARLAEAFGLQRERKLDEKSLREFVTEMALRGREIWDQLYSVGSDALQGSLRTIAASNEPLTIQHLRLQPTFSFPWLMVYDWEVPDNPVARERARICLGGGCDCTSDRTDVICVRGFWGIRHVIEEFVRSDDINAPTDTVAHAAGTRPVACTLGVADDWSVKLVSRLESRFGPIVCARLAAEESLFQRLRDDAQRPAVLVVIGHLTHKAIAGVPDAPDPPRISIEAVERFLHPKALVKEAMKNKWIDPHRPVVLLLACGSSANVLGEFTHDFVVRLSNLGAAAVVACEEKIDTSLAADVADWIIGRIRTTGPGEALRSWRAQLIAGGNPCGFMFGCFGNAHVTDPAFPLPTD